MAITVNPGDIHRMEALEDVSFLGAIANVYPKTEVQLGIVYLVRDSLRFVSWKERKAVGRDLRMIYGAPTVEAAEHALAAFEKRRPLTQKS